MSADTNVRLAYHPTSWLIEEHDHEWTERRVKAIWRQCACGKGELIHDHPMRRGRKKGQKDIVPRKARSRPEPSPEMGERGEQWERRYRNGETLEAIGNDYGVSRERVRQVLVKMGVDTKAIIRERAERRVAERPTERLCHLGCGQMLPLDGQRGEMFSKETWYAHRRANHPWIKPADAAKHEAVVADYDTGMKQKDLTAKYHCAPSLVYRALRYAGRGPSKRPTASRLPKIAQSKERQEAIAADLRETDLTLDAIAARHHVSHALIYQLNKRFGVRPIDSHLVTPEIEARMHEYMIGGTSNVEIGRIFGYDATTVGRHLRKYR
jgi:uncharacterized protein (DUF433 family)